ncbi:MAG TPA: hypothetical protein VHD31_02320 [Candidatus Paceibacterota bacterium]|nr:hypothetical protein [Candidatus Paceibacterota bacterium]
MTAHAKKKVAVLSAIAFVVGIGLPITAVNLGEKMQQVPLDKMALVIEIFRN